MEDMCNEAALEKAREIAKNFISGVKCGVIPTYGAY
jgi:hypothetical protein